MVITSGIGVALRASSGGDFEETGRTHATADAHGHDHPAHTAATTFEQRVPDETATGHAVGVADRDATAVDVELVGIDLERVAAVDDLAGERLVQFPEADVLDREPGVREQLRHGGYRADAHLAGRDAG